MEVDLPRRQAAHGSLGSEAVRDADAPFYINVKRWRTYLLEHSEAFRRLQEERQRGWSSTALDEWYARRQSGVTQHSSSPPPTAEPAVALKVTPPSKADYGTTAFLHADVSALAERYRQHAQRIMQRAASDFFTVAPPLTTSTNAETREVSVRAAGAEPPVDAVPASNQVGRCSVPLFLDLGCAPGGVSKFLVEDLQWQGIGVTLAHEDGGIDVDEALLNRDLRVGGPSFILLDGDVTQSPRSWRRSAAYQKVTGVASEAVAAVMAQAPGRGQKATGERESRSALDVGLDLLTSGVAKPQPLFHFVNGGAVLDHGQRRRDEGAGAAAYSSSVGETAGIPWSAEGPPHGSRAIPVSGHASSGEKILLGSPDIPHAPTVILPWFSLLVPQLQTALTYVADGGSLMLVHGAPHCASLFILLRAMEEVVGVAPIASANAPISITADSASTTSSACRVHVLETMHLAKAPVYLLWTKVRRSADSDELSAAAETPKRWNTAQEACACLLESLTAEKPRVSPLPSSPAGPPRSSSAPSPSVGIFRESSLDEKRQLWLGESDEGFRLAVEGFQRYGPLVESVWKRAETFLRLRRERAEQFMRSTGHRIGEQGAQSTVASQRKRVR